MAEAAYANNQVIEPRIIKISRKRQITIPADMYKKAGNPDCALATWNEDGSITIEPLLVKNEVTSVKILRSLIEQGLEGEDLIGEYEKIINHIVDFNQKTAEHGEDEAGS